MTDPRPHVSLETKLAATLAALCEAQGDPIPYEHLKLMTADQVISLFHFDHYPHRHADKGPTIHWNMRPLPILGHRVKSAKKDAPELAKERRIRRDEDKWRNFTAPKGDKPEPRKPRWGSRPLRSRNGFNRRPKRVG